MFLCSRTLINEFLLLTTRCILTESVDKVLLGTQVQVGDSLKKKLKIFVISDLDRCSESRKKEKSAYRVLGGTSAWDLRGEIGCELGFLRSV